jgi:hypothetical protein
MEEEKGTKTDFVKEEIRNGKLFPALMACAVRDDGVEIFRFLVCLGGMSDTTSNPAAAHPFLCTDALGGKVAMVAADGKVAWEHKCENPQDCWITPDGNYFFCFETGVVEKLSDGRTLWDYNAPEGSFVCSCEPLPTGHFLVGENGPCRLIEINNMGNILKEFRLTPPPPSVAIRNQLSGVRRTADGHFLICRKGEREIEELDADGNSLRRIPVAGDVRMALRLPNGHWLAALGNAHKLQELDAELKVVWELGENDASGNPLRCVTGFQRLPNGNTIVCNTSGDDQIGRQPQVFEVTRDRKVVWEFSDPVRFASINQIQRADVRGNVMVGEILR